MWQKLFQILLLLLSATILTNTNLGNKMKKILCYLLLLSSSVVVAQESLMDTILPSEKANDFTLTTPDGQLISLSDYRGKYVLVNFWAHWCSPCIKEFPAMQKLYDEADKDNFEIIGIHAGSFNEQAAEFVSHFKISFPIVVDADTSLKGWDVPALPMTYLINPQGEMIFKALGPREWNYEELQTLISSSKKAVSVANTH
jgi:peroxiredoxin